MSLEEDIIRVMEVKARLAEGEAASLRRDLQASHIRCMALIKAAGGEVRISRSLMEDLNPINWMIVQEFDFDTDCSIVRLKRRTPNAT